MEDSLISQRGRKYGQVFDALRGEILSGRYREGEKLPSEIDLVKRFGTSRITVGRAIRELRDMDLVERRAGSGTYVRALKSSGLTFGLLIPNLGETEIFESICRGMADAGKEHALLWGHAMEDGGRAEEALRLCRQFIERRVTGVFFAPLELTPEDESINHRIVADLEKARIPIVLLDRCYFPHPQRSPHDLVGIDNRRAGYLATRHLLELGCQRAAFLSRRHGAWTVDARIAGYHEAVRSFGACADAGWVCDFDALDLTAVRNFLDKVRPEAVVCVNDRIAATLMRSLISLGHSVPADIRIVGIDDAGYAELLPVPLTTIRQPCREIGFAAIETMLSRLGRPNRPARDVLLKTDLVVRKSCGAMQSS